MEFDLFTPVFAMGLHFTPVLGARLFIVSLSRNA